MSPYALNKTLSIGIPLLLLLGCLLVTDANNPALWWTLIIITHTLGYTHFILGYVYQYRALKRNENKKPLSLFFILTLVSVLFSLFFIAIDALPLLAVIAIGYFITHGVLNEVTQMKEFLQFAPSISDMIPLVFYLLAFFLLSLTHPSFFFTPALEFSNPSPENAVALLSLVLPVSTVQLIAFICGMLFLILLPGKLLYRGNYISAFLITAVALSTFSILYFLQPLSYVVLYFFALSYHFISWGIFILQKFSAKAPQRIPQYVREHLYVIVPLLGILTLLLLNVPTINSFQVFVYNGIIFIILAMIHNTTSLLNEDWFKKLLKRYL